MQHAYVVQSGCLVTLTTVLRATCKEVPCVLHHTMENMNRNAHLIAMYSLVDTYST